MKTQKNFLAIFIAFIVGILTLSAFSTAKHTETSTFKVYGNCSMCKKRIETALSKNTNIKKSSWDEDTKMLTVEYDPQGIDLLSIHKIVATAGHDTDKFKANTKVYNSLPDCCQYERKK